MSRALDMVWHLFQCCVFCFKQKTAYEMRISDWSSDVCSSDLEQLDAALAAGVNFVDTAEMYPVAPRAETYGRPEQIIGSWLARTARRHDLILVSKVIGPGAFPLEIGKTSSRERV